MMLAGDKQGGGLGLERDVTGLAGHDQRVAAQPGQFGLQPPGVVSVGHRHATTLLLSGVPVHIVAARLGHADPAITLRVYTYVIRTAEAAAADIFARAINA
jgi:hypothetical protein